MNSEPMVPQSESAPDSIERPAVRETAWPHMPPHRLGKEGTYFVTAGTYLKAHFFRTTRALKLLHDALLDHAASHAWQLEAWAVFSNHYHFVARPGRESSGRTDLGIMINRLHRETASMLNTMTGNTGRKVWHSFRDSLLTYERSWLARLHYTHENPRKHGLVADSRDYPWCSASWFERTSKAAWRETVYSFKIDKLQIDDEF